MSDVELLLQGCEFHASRQPLELLKTCVCVSESSRFGLLTVM